MGPAPVALVTCLALPEPDADREVLRAALEAEGVDARWVAWDDPAVDWSSFSMAVVRSTWNYVRAFDAFLDWVTRADRATRLFNPAEVLRYSAHKGYLAGLAARGVPVVPTEFLPRGAPLDLPALMDRRGWRDAVVKPVVSAGSFGTSRVHRDDAPAAGARLGAMVAEREMMVQPYLPSVEAHGERALVFIDGELTHAVRKSPRFTGDREAITGPFPVSPAEREVAVAALSAAPGPLLYARVDVAPGPDGRPLVMELELLEPSLFLSFHPPALARLARAIRQRSPGR